MTNALSTRSTSLESEAIHIFREVAGEFDRPVILFSGGKDSTRAAAPGAQGVLAGAAAVRAAARRHRAQLPRGARVPRPTSSSRYGLRLDVANVQDYLDDGRLAERPTAPATRCRPCRCSTRSPRTGSTRCSAAAAATRSGPAPRSGSSACATHSGSGTPAASAPSCGTSTTAGTRPGEHVRVFPLSTGPSWTSGATSPARTSNCRRSTTHTSGAVFQRDGMWLARALGRPARGARVVEKLTVRYRTVGDGSCTGAVESDGRRRSTRSSPRSRRRRLTERGRHPRRRPLSEAAMEDRKREGYF